MSFLISDVEKYVKLILDTNPKYITRVATNINLTYTIKYQQKQQILIKKVQLLIRR